MNPMNKLLIAPLALTGLVSACATTPSQQLLQARDAYSTASQGLASQLTPTDLYDAKKVLDQADREFQERGDTLESRDYAYIAYRKVQLAEAKARTERDRQQIVAAVSAGVQVRDAQVKQTKEALAQTRETLKEVTRDKSATAEQLAKTAQELEAERNARTSAEKQLDGAMKDLASVAAVKEEPRGVVITLSGGVLFPSGKATLLNTAKTKLDQVAEALKAQGSDKKMIVEGHTDAQGSATVNEPLSMNRAVAVRDYLVASGVPPEKITPVGMGARKPLVDNTTAENRANNRRVEIVITPETPTVP